MRGHAAPNAYLSREYVLTTCYLQEMEFLCAMADTLLDATGLKCPIPVLKARKAVKSMADGDRLEILATDPGAVADFDAFCRTGGHDLIERSQDDDVYRFLIRISA